MSVTVYFDNVSKRRNSTLQGTFTHSYDCTLKAPTSLDRPTFLVSAPSMDYNAAKFENRYYLVDDVVSVRNGQWEVSCVLDVLATYKSDILASTQFVAYSSYKSSDWLPDTRIPVLRSVEYTQNTKSLPFITSEGFYCLTVTGKNGCECFAVSQTDINSIIADIQTWAIDDFTKILNGNYDPNTQYNYDFSTPQAAVESLAKILSQNGAIGNAYQNAPQMIRSCIWVPFDASYFYSNAFPKVIYLGNYETSVRAYPISAKAYGIGLSAITIPWKHSDWRRSTCETVYLKLPYAGLIQLGSDTLTNVSSLQITASACAVDGTIAYEVLADTKTIGYYSGSCAASYAIGINQRAGLGEVVQTLIAGVEKTVAVAVDSSLSPMSIAGSVAGAALEGINTAYQTVNTAMTTHPSCVGSMGSAASAGLNQTVAVIVVSHDTVTTPAAIASVLGYPTMAPMSLSSLTGYCQCSNAHVSLAAQAREIDAVDYYLNSGFFIE